MTVVEEAITKVLEEKSLAFPRTVTVAVSSVAAFLVVTNIVLIVCVLHRRRQVNSNSSQGEMTEAVFFSIWDRDSGVLLLLR